MINITKPLTPKSISQQKQQQQHPYKNISTTKSNNNPQASGSKSFVQEKYPSQLYESEIKIHNQSLAEYDLDIYDIMVNLIETNKPNLSLYKQQPYLTFTIRLKLIDFLLKMSIRLKILPFVFFKAVKIFDRYCSKRIVLLDQSQLIITTCLWIASKVMGGNNHFVNINNLDKIGHENFRTINDLGYGCGGKYLGPTERFRLPKLHELVKLCGAKCKYDQGMFKQMEVHVLNTLEWSLNDPSIEEFIIDSHEFNVININNNNEYEQTITTNDESANANANDGNEFFKIKEFLSYAALYSHDLIDTNIIELGQVIMDLINETFQLQPFDKHYQTILNCDSDHPIRFDMQRYKHIKKAVIKSVLNASDFMMKVFHSKGPQFIYQQFNLQYKLNYTTNSIIGGFGNSGYSPTTITTTTSDNISTTPTNSTGSTTPVSSYIGYANSRSSSVSSTSSVASSSNANTPSSSCSTTSTTPLGMTPHKRQKNYSNYSNYSNSSTSLGLTNNNNNNTTISPVDSTTINSHTKNSSQLNYQYHNGGSNNNNHHHHHKPSLSVSIPPPQMHSHHHSSTVYQMVTPPNLANKNSNKSNSANNNNTTTIATTTATTTNNNNSQLPAPHQLSYNNYFNSPNMQPPPMKYTPGCKQQQQQNQGQNQQQPLQLYQGDNNNNGTNTNSKFNSIAGSRAVSSSSSSAVSIASSISTNNYDKYDDDDDDDNSNDLFSSSRRFMNYSNYSSSTINGSVMSGVINNNSGNGKGNGNGGSGTPISENDSPIYTKTRLCNMIH